MLQLLPVIVLPRWLAAGILGVSGSFCIAGASKFYSEALKQGTTESLMSLTTGSTDSSGMDAASRITAVMGPVDEKVSNM